MIDWLKKLLGLGGGGESPTELVATAVEDDSVFRVIRTKLAVLDVGSLLAERYLVERMHLEGGRGLLFVRDRKERNAPRVIKILPSDPEQSRDWRDELIVMREAARTTWFVLDFFTTGVLEVGDDEYHFLVMPFCEGGDLARWAEEDRPARARVRHLMEVAWGLARVEEAIPGFVHGDVKPQNVLLGRYVENRDGVLAKLPSPRAIVADFGASRVRPDRELVALSRRYAAPERAFGPATPRADVFSFGVMAYELLAGAYPFSDDLPTGVSREPAERQRAAQLLDPRCEELPESFSEAVFDCLDPNPEGRPASFREVFEALSSGLAFVDEEEPGIDVLAGKGTYQYLTFGPDRNKPVQRMGLQPCVAAEGLYSVPSSLLYGALGIHRTADGLALEPGRERVPLEGSFLEINVGDVLADNPMLRSYDLKEALLNYATVRGSLQINHEVFGYLGSLEVEDSVISRVVNEPSLGTFADSRVCWFLQILAESLFVQAVNSGYLESPNLAKHANLRGAVFRFLDLSWPVFERLDVLGYRDALADISFTTDFWPRVPDGKFGEYAVFDFVTSIPAFYLHGALAWSLARLARPGVETPDIATSLDLGEISLGFLRQIETSRVNGRYVEQLAKLAPDVRDKVEALATTFFALHYSEEGEAERTRSWRARNARLLSPPPGGGAARAGSELARGGEDDPIAEGVSTVLRGFTLQRPGEGSSFHLVLPGPRRAKMFCCIERVYAAERTNQLVRQGFRHGHHEPFSLRLELGLGGSPDHPVDVASVATVAEFLMCAFEQRGVMSGRGVVIHLTQAGVLDTTSGLFVGCQASASRLDILFVVMEKRVPGWSDEALGRRAQRLASGAIDVLRDQLEAVTVPVPAVLSLPRELR